MGEELPYLNVVISCHDFLANETGDASLKTKSLMISALTSAGFDVETREDDRDFVADYIYGTRASIRSGELGRSPST